MPKQLPKVWSQYKEKKISRQEVTCAIYWDEEIEYWTRILNSSTTYHRGCIGNELKHCIVYFRLKHMKTNYSFQLSSEPLRKGGQNGLVIVLTLFSWWGQKIQLTVHCNAEIVVQWSVAITDLRHTLEAMGVTAQKHTSPTRDISQPRNKRQRCN